MQINQTPKKRYYLTFFIFLGFFVVLIIQHQYLFIYWDDYGYASLSFINNIPDVAGTHFTFAQFLDFYYLHYLTATGRVIAQSLSTVMMASDIWVPRITQSIVIILLLFTIYKIIMRNTHRKDFLAATVVCCLYGLLEIYLINGSIFWISATVTYLWPLAPMIAGCWIYYRYAIEGERIHKTIKVLAVAGLVFSATAQEQLATAQIFMLALIFIWKLVKYKKISTFDIVVIACSVAGALFLMLAPAMAVRSAALAKLPNYADFTSLSLVQKIAYGYRTVLQYLFSKNFYLFMIAVLTCGSFVGWKLFKTKKGNQILNAALTIVGFGSLAAMIVFYDGLYTLIQRFGIPDNLIYGFLAVFLLLLIYGVTVYYRKTDKKFMLLTYYGAWISILCMIVVMTPTSGRVYIPYVFLSFILLGDILCDMITAIRLKQIKVIAVGLILLVVALNMTSYTIRFYKTSAGKIENDALLKSVSEKIKNGEDIKVVKIRPYPNIESDVFQPNIGVFTVYDDSTIACIKEYYDLPQSIVLDWKD